MDIERIKNGNTKYLAKNVVYYSEIGSTQDEIRKLAENNVTGGTLVITDNQTSGHGTKGRTWNVEGGKNINMSFVIKVLLMSLGFFLILAIRDSFQVYIEDVALGIANKDEQQKIIIKIEVSRRIGTLILSTLFTLILMRYELVVVEFILLILSIIEIFISKQLCNKLSKMKKEN